MPAVGAEAAVAALSEVLETNDKQHLSITILLNDNQQLQDKLAAVEAEFSVAIKDKDAALAAGKATERLLAESQVLIQQAHVHPIHKISASRGCMMCIALPPIMHSQVTMFSCHSSCKHLFCLTSTEHLQVPM